MLFLSVLTCSDKKKTICRCSNMFCSISISRTLLLVPLEILQIQLCVISLWKTSQMLTLQATKVLKKPVAYGTIRRNLMANICVPFSILLLCGRWILQQAINLTELKGTSLQALACSSVSLLQLYSWNIKRQLFPYCRPIGNKRLERNINNAESWPVALS
jgi:uncharacterized membrane protein